MDTSTMDELSDGEQDNQNTNRSEVFTSSMCEDQLVSPTEDCPTSETKNDERSLSKQESFQEENSFQIPTIIITPPSDDEGDSLQDTSMSAKETKDSDLDMEVSIDKDKSQDTSNGLDTTSEDDFEVICRCSSTPLSANNDSHSSLSSQKSAAPSIEDASPIKKAEESKGIKESAALDSVDDITYIQSHYGTRVSETDEMGSDSVNEEDVTKDQLASSAGYDTSPLASVTQPVPVYNVNGNTVTYISGPVTSAGSYNSAYSEDSGCHMQIPNGFSINYSSSMPEDSPTGETANASGEQSAENPGAGDQQSDAYNFVYPSIYVSNAGLISVLLRHDMSVEMTVDRTIRVVSHQHMMAVATDSRGTSACLYHPALKVIQQGTTTDIATDAVRVHMGHDDVAFAIGNSRYRFDAYDIQPATHVKFSDIFKDQSVNLLFSSEGYGESLVPHCLEVASKAEYANLPKGGVIVRINGVKVTQTGGGDVTVVTGAKFIRLSPSFGMTRLGNRFIDIEIERDWSCRVSRGPHGFFAGDRRVIITNGKLEVDVNENGRFKVAHLTPPHHPVTSQQGLRHHQPDNYVRRVNSVTYTPSAAARAALAARTPPLRRRSAPVTH